MEKTREINITFFGCACSNPECRGRIIVRRVTTGGDGMDLMIISEAFSAEPRVLLRGPLEYSELNAIMIKWLLVRNAHE